MYSYYTVMYYNLSSLKMVYHCPQTVVDMLHLQDREALAVEVELDGQDQTELHLGIQEQWDMELR